MSQQTNVLNALKADNLLEGSVLLEQITTLRNSMALPSEGQAYNFDDYFDLLRKEIAKLPRLTLLQTVPPRQEANYLVQLTEGLDTVLTRVDYVGNKVIAFQTHLINVQTQVEEIKGGFEAWYILAAHEYLSAQELKLPSATVRNLAAAEFSRLMGGTGVAVLTLQTAVKAELAALASRKSMAKQKFEMGREQVNASWANQLPEMAGISSAPGSLRLVEEGDEDEEEEDAIPAFVSQRQIASQLPRELPALDPAKVNIVVQDVGQVVAQEEFVQSLDTAKPAPVELPAEDEEPEPESQPTPVAAEPEPEEEPEPEPVFMGVDIASGKDVTTVALVAHGEVIASGVLTDDESPEDGAKRVQREHMTEAHTEAITKALKQGDPQEVAEVTPAQAVASFNDAEDDGLRPEAEEEVSEDEMVAAEEAAAVSEEPPVAKPAAATQRKAAAVVLAEDDLDDLVPVAPPVKAETPTPKTPPAVAVPAAARSRQPRKKLDFVLEEEEI